jgi:hypothetical protein
VHEFADWGDQVDYFPGCDPEVDFGPATTGWDSLLADADPIWLYVGLEGASGEPFVDDPAVGKVFALPLNKWRVDVNKALLDLAQV